MKLSQEKQEIIDYDDNALVVANPGTGKTLLLACKYVDLIKKGLKPEEILCLTFTKKARAEMENRIIKSLKEDKVEADLSKLQVYTFHSYALDNIEEDSVISSNLLRYSIYRYLKDNEVLNYGDDYLLTTIVPKMENLIRYLKSFGIMPDKIDLEKAGEFLEDSKKLSKEDLERFLEQFVKIFRNYEEMKGRRGCDYADLLIRFLELRKIEKFKYVLVDELQDVNKLEADIALKSAEKFMAVGDQKQAIFGFQGGSILNFEKFADSKEFVLSENFRSTNEILGYAKEDFSGKTRREDYRKALENLRNAEAESGPKPTIYDVQENMPQAVCELTKDLLKKSKQVAVIARTNRQIMEISKEFARHNIEHSSTYFSASAEAKANIIVFLRGVFSSNTDFVKNAMFTPFLPIPLHKAFELSAKKKISVNEILESSPEFRKLRESVSGIEDINKLFREKIIPVAISYGKEYLLAALSVQESCKEAIALLENKDLASFAAYLESSDLLANESDIEKKVVVTTIHKAKGKEFDTVLFVPSKITDRSNFQDKVVEAILKSKGINADEELEEETLRSHFVAFTRAKKRLFILTDRPVDFLNDLAETEELALEGEAVEAFEDLERRAYNLFVNKEYDKAKEQLEKRSPWLKAFVKNHFESLEHISFSALTSDPYKYFTGKILNIWVPSAAVNIGSELHSTAEKILKGENPAVSAELEPYVKNVRDLISEITKIYSKVEEVEVRIRVPLSEIIPTQDPIAFFGIIDAVFSNGKDFLIVDWKTSKNDDYSSDYRQQLEVYRRILSSSKNIPLDKIKVAIGYVGLRNRINDGKINAKLDDKQPAGTAFNTVSKKLEKFLEWRSNTDKFFEELLKNKNEDVLWRSLVEQHREENGSGKIKPSKTKIEFAKAQ